MSQNARESLSALMDNEGDELELRRVLKAMDESPDAAAAWRRYHLMRSLMRREPEVDVMTDLSAGITARLRDEPVPQLDAETPAPRRALPMARSAGIAAAVSLMVITGVQFYNGGLPGSGESELANSPGSAGTTLSAGQASTGQLSPVGLNAGDGNTVSRPSLADLLLFQGQSRSGNQGLMTVGAQAPMFMAPSPQQSLRSDEEQARLLQSYLDRHAEGAAYRSGDAWMPLLRASGSETLGTR
jgi:sigma-E factor negative regulatory protein RseA